MSEYQICTRCIMDTSAPEITFDSETGECNFCKHYDELYAKRGYIPGKSEEHLRSLFDKIKQEGRNKDYDCVLGISGGVDSSYLAHVAVTNGLRVLAVHVDAGWNSEVAVNNIQKICSGLQIDLQTVVVDWPTMKELQRAYLFSGLPDLDVPQDHSFIAAIYHYARKEGLNYILGGGNIATEGILPPSWVSIKTDFRLISSVYKKHGRGAASLAHYPHIGFVQDIRRRSTMKTIEPLDYIPYSKKLAIEFLSSEYGWEYYGGKHFESRFTKFFQSYYLPEKFHYDKRRAHLSSLIVGGELTREDALREIEKPYAYPIEEILEDRDYILKKLDVSQDEWKSIMDAEGVSEDDYPNNKTLYSLGKKILKR